MTDRCKYCHKRIFKSQTSDWYHSASASTSCYPGQNSWKKAEPR